MAANIRDVIQFIATVLSPLLVIWVGIATNELHTRLREQREAQDKAIARQDQAIVRQDQLQRDAISRQDQLAREAFSASASRFEHTKSLFNDLMSKEAEQKRLAVLSALAFIDEQQIPEFFLAILAITESKDPEIATYLRQALRELSLDQDAPTAVRNAATRALALMVSTDDLVKLQRGETDEVTRANVQALADTGATLATQSATASKPEEKKQAQRQLQELAATVAAVAVSAPDAATKAEAAATLEKSPASRTTVEHAVAEITAKLPSDAQSALIPRIYLRIQDEKQRPRAEELKQALIQKGNLVPGVEIISTPTAGDPAKVLVRYFDPDSKAGAEAILKVLQSKKIDGEVTLVTPGPDRAASSTNTKTEFEILAGRNALQ